MKPIFRIIPLIYFTLLGLFWIAENYMTTGTVNYIAIAVTVLIIAQFFYKNRVAGIATGVVMGLFSFYMLLALLDDIMDASGDPNYRFIATAGSIFGVGVLMAVLLTVYSAKSKSAMVLNA
jgi:hypothetical protein